MGPKLAAALLAVGAMCAGGASSAHAGSYEWTGLNPSNPSWSQGDNWLGGAAPAAPVDQLRFPVLASPQCDVPYSATCYAAENDLPGLAVEELVLAGRVPYRLTGDRPILGAGGIRTVPGSAGPPGFPIISLPLELQASQTWDLTNGGVRVAGGMVGGASALNVELGDQGFLALAGSNEIGPVTARSTSVSPAKSPSLGLGGDTTTLNATTGNPVHVEGIGLGGTGTIGPLSTEGAGIAVSGPRETTSWPATIHVNGPVTLDPASGFYTSLYADGDWGPNSYGRLVATGDINLASARLSIGITKPNSFNECLTGLLYGRVYTLFKTTEGHLSGEFAGIPDGSAIFPWQVDQVMYYPEPEGVKVCPKYAIRIDYTSNAVVATVFNPNATPGPTGRRAAATKKCKRLARRAASNGKPAKKRLRKCMRRAKRLPA
jgi:hypothetical protein